MKEKRKEKEKEGQEQTGFCHSVFCPHPNTPLPRRLREQRTCGPFALCSSLYQVSHSCWPQALCSTMVHPL